MLGCAVCIEEVGHTGDQYHPNERLVELAVVWDE